MTATKNEFGMELSFILWFGINAMKLTHLWLILTALFLLLPALFGGYPSWPTAFNNLRNPLLLVVSVTLIFCISSEFRKGVAKVFMDWETGITDRHERIILLTILAFYLFVFTKTTILRYSALAVNAEDFSFFDYLIPNTLWGRFMQTPACHYCNHFSIHPTWIVFLFVPFQILTSSPVFCLLLCPLVLWMAAIPIYGISKKLSFPRQFRLCMILIYLNLFSVQRALMYDFHIENLAPVILLSMTYYVLQRKWLWATLFAFAFVSIKEDMPLYLAALAAGVLLQLKLRRSEMFPLEDQSIVYFGWAILLGSLAFFEFDMQMVKYFSHQASYQVLAPASIYGSKPAEIIWGIVNHPARSILDILKGGWLPLSAVFLFYPILFLPTLLPLLVHIIIHACSGMPRMSGLSIYFGAPLVPFLVLGFSYVICKWISEERSAIEPRKVRYRYLVSLSFAIAMVQSLTANSGYLEFFRPAHGYDQLNTLIDSMDLSKRICAQTSLFPHLPHAKFTFILDEQCEYPDLILISDESSSFPLSQVQKENLVSQLISQNLFSTRTLGQFTLYTRISDGKVIRK